MNFSLISAIQSANRAGPVLSCSAIQIYNSPGALTYRTALVVCMRWRMRVYEYMYASNYVGIRYRIHYIVVVAVMENIDDFYRERLWREEQRGICLRPSLIGKSKKDRLQVNSDSRILIIHVDQI